MSIPPGSKCIPIAQLRPELRSRGDVYVEGIITLVWPYSRKQRTLSVLLVEPDFRLRGRHGQVRVHFTKSSAAAIAQSHISSGDRLRINLQGAEWEEPVSVTSTPGRSVAWELHFRSLISLTIERPEAESTAIDLNNEDSTPEPSESGSTPSTSPVQPRRPLETPNRLGVTLGLANGTWASPAFLKRSNPTTSSFDPFAADDEAFPDNDRQKKFKFGEGVGQWRFGGNSPSPEKEKAVQVNGRESPPSQISQESLSARQATPIEDARIDNGSPIELPPAQEVPELMAPQRAASVVSLGSSVSGEGTDVEPESDAVVGQEQEFLGSQAPATGPEQLQVDDNQLLTSPDAFVKATTEMLDQYPDYFPFGGEPVDDANIPGNLLPMEASVNSGNAAGPWLHEFGTDGAMVSRQQYEPQQTSFEEIGARTDQVQDVPARFASADASQEDFEDHRAVTEDGPRSSRDYQDIHSLPERADLGSEVEHSAQNAGLQPVPVPSGASVEALSSQYLTMSDESGLVQQGPESHENVDYVAPSPNMSAPINNDVHQGTPLPKPRLTGDELENLHPAPYGTASVAADSLLLNKRASVEIIDLDSEDEEGENAQLVPHDLQIPIAESLHSFSQEPDAPLSQTEQNEVQREQPETDHMVSMHPLSYQRLEEFQPPQAESTEAQPSAVTGHASIQSEDVQVNRLDSTRLDMADSETQTRREPSPSSAIQEIEDMGPEVAAETDNNKHILSQVSSTPEASIEVDTQVSIPRLTQDTSADLQPLLSPVTSQKENERDSSPIAPSDTEPAQQIEEQQDDITQSVALAESPTTQISRGEDGQASQITQTTETTPKAVSDGESPLIRRIKEQRRLSSLRRSDRLSSSRTANPWFAPRDEQESDVNDKQEPIDEPKLPTAGRIGPRLKTPTPEPPDARLSQEYVRSSPRLSSPLNSPQTSQYLPPSQPAAGFRTNLSYFVPLGSLHCHYGMEVDVMAVTIGTKPIIRAESGPRDYIQSTYLADPSSDQQKGAEGNKVTTTQFFRPRKTSLPRTIPGDVILLRNFKVQSFQNRLALLSTESSAWAVFRKETEVQVRGPPIEYGPEERAFARALWSWWESYEESARVNLLSASANLASSQSSTKTPKTTKKKGLGFEIPTSKNKSSKKGKPPPKDDPTSPAASTRSQTSAHRESFKFDEPHQMKSPQEEAPSSPSGPSRNPPRSKKARDTASLSPRKPRTRAKAKAKDIPEHESRDGTKYKDVEPEDEVDAKLIDAPEHELRDGTKYKDVDPVDEVDAKVIDAPEHELRDGTKYTDIENEYGVDAKEQEQEKTETQTNVHRLRGGRTYRDRT